MGLLIRSAIGLSIVAANLPAIEAPATVTAAVSDFAASAPQRAQAACARDPDLCLGVAATIAGAASAFAAPSPPPRPREKPRASP